MSKPFTITITGTIKTQTEDEDRPLPQKVLTQLLKNAFLLPREDAKTLGVVCSSPVVSFK